MDTRLKNDFTCNIMIKQIRFYFVFFLIVSVISSCKEQQSEIYFKNNYILLDSLCKKNYSTLINSGYDLDKTFGSSYKRLINIQNKATYLLKSIDENKISIDSINYFNSYVYETILKYQNVSIPPSGFTKEDGEITENNAILKYQIKQLEYLATNIIINRLLYDRYDFNEIQTLVVPEKSKIILGEEYQARLYIATGNFNKGYIAVIDGDTVETFHDGLVNVPLYKTKPTTIGEHVSDGYLLVNSYGKLVKYPFKVAYQVVK